MRKIDKLLLKSFLGPFFLTFVVVVFILLMQHMLKYMDDILGKDLGFWVIAELLMYFAVFMTPVALPLAVLLSALMTYGNLGEHFELTAIKSAGISLIRTLRPLFIFVCFVTVFAFLSNNYLVPKAALKAYSLLYDIKQKKPGLDLKEGTFYNGIPGYSIKVEEKFDDGITLKDLIIYNHAKRIGNSQIIIADSGRMKTIMDGRYLSLELFNGKRYAEGQSARSIQKRNRGEPGEYLRSSFDRSHYVFSLASFDLGETPDELFGNNKMMKDISKLRVDIDSMYDEVTTIKYTVYKAAETANSYHMAGVWSIPDKVNRRKLKLDSINRVKMMEKGMDSLEDNPQYKYSSPTIVAQNIKTRDSLKQVRDSLKNLKEQPDDEKLVTKKSVESQKIDQARMQDLEKKIEQNFQGGMSDSMRFARELAKRSRKSSDSDDDEEIDLPVKEGNISNNDIDRVKRELATDKVQEKALNLALSRTRQVKTRLSNQLRKLENVRFEIAGHIIKLHQKYSHAMACMIMFLIGAPLGAIIKRGGLGVPVLISIFFFIIFYVLVISGQNWGEEGAMDPVLSVWVADLVLLPFGVVFMIQAKNDARLFDSDFYYVILSKIKKSAKKEAEEPTDKSEEIREEFEINNTG